LKTANRNRRQTDLGHGVPRITAVDPGVVGFGCGLCRYQAFLWRLGVALWPRRGPCVQAFGRISRPDDGDELRKS